MRLWLIMMLACSGEDASSTQAEPAPSKASNPVPTARALTHAVPAEVREEAGWGAVFWRAGQAWKVGGGQVMVSATVARVGSTQGDPNVCGGVAVKGAPAGAAIALPEGSPVPEIQKTPAIRAHLVERAAWRLDEILPPRDKYSPAVGATSPAQQRGVSVGSVAKTRRKGAPPILISTGVRDCTAAVAVLDAKAEYTLAYDQVPGPCEKLRVLPATQLDSGPEREFAVFSDTHVILYRLHEESRRPRLSRIGQWTCDKAAGGG
jgi:hypothetical protein